MRRWTLRIFLFLLLGAIVNVGVAWGCEIRCEYLRRPLTMSGTAQAGATWAHLALPTWDAAPPTYEGHRYELGHRWLHIQAGTWNYIKPDGQSVTSNRYLADEICAGWPFLALRCVQRLDAANPGWVIRGKLKILIAIRGSPYVSLPFLPIWPGFAINTVFYAGVLWVMFAGPFVWRRRQRVRRGLCPKCAYDLRGSVGPCPECGFSRTA